MAIQLLSPVPLWAEDDPGRGLTLNLAIPEGPFNFYDVVPLTIQVSSIVSQPLTNVQFHLPPNPDIYYLSGTGVPEEGSPYTTLDLGTLEGGASQAVTLTVRIEGIPLEPTLSLPFRATASESDSVTAEASLPLNLGEGEAVQTSGGEIALATGRVNLSLPPQSTPLTLSFHLLEQHQLRPGEEK